MSLQQLRIKVEYIKDGEVCDSLMLTQNLATKGTSAPEATGSALACSVFRMFKGEDCIKAVAAFNEEMK